MPGKPLVTSKAGGLLQVPNWSREDLQDILSDALSQAWTPAQEAVLNSEAGMETVIDAVVRVTAKVLPSCCSGTSCLCASISVQPLLNAASIHACVSLSMHAISSGMQSCFHFCIHAFLY